MYTLGVLSVRTGKWICKVYPEGESALSPVCHVQVHNTALILLHEWLLPPDPMGRGKDTTMPEGNFILMDFSAALALHPTSV